MSTAAIESPFREWFRYQTVNFTISEFIEERQARDKDRRFVLPPFQRPYVWSVEQQARFIESIFGGLPIGSYVLNVPELPGQVGDMWLLDGQQRWGAIHSFMRDEFSVHGKVWSEIPRGYQGKLKATPFPCLETRSNDLAEMERIYNLMAYGGTPHV